MRCRRVTNFDGVRWSVLVSPLGFDSFNASEDIWNRKKLFHIWQMLQNIQPPCLSFCFQVSTQFIHQTIRIIILLSFTSGFWRRYSALVMLTGKIEFYNGNWLTTEQKPWPQQCEVFQLRAWTFVNYCKFIKSSSF